MYIHYTEYKEAASQFEKLIERMKSDLEAYSQNPKANKKYIYKQKSTIKQLLFYYEAAHETIRSLVKESDQLLRQFRKLNIELQSIREIPLERINWDIAKYLSIENIAYMGKFSNPKTISETQLEIDKLNKLLQAYGKQRN